MLIKHFSNGNKSEFARMLGVSPQAISTWMSRNTFDIDIIHSKCVNVSAEWLLTGEGEMLKPTTPVSAKVPPMLYTEESHPVLHATKSPKRGKGIPLIPLNALAGFPLDSQYGVSIEDCEYYNIPEFERKGADFLIRVSGDSMIPLYYSGDLVACKKLASIQFFQWGTIYTLETSQGVLIKRIQESVEHDDCILCVSENSTIHHPFLLPKSDIRSLSIIIGLVRLV